MASLESGGESGGGSATGGQQKNGPIVHMRADSDSTLLELFSVTRPGSQRPLQVPLRMRKLPPSFWNPGYHHSRENSADGSTAADPTTPPDQSAGSPRPAASPQQPPPQPPPPAQQPPQPPPQQLQPFHNRAHSSPATLQQNPQQVQSQLLHLRQPSYESSVQEDNLALGPLPPDWGMARAPSGQIYFMDHKNKTTQWEDPRKQLHAQLLQEQQLSPLPDGWEQSMTEEGEVYFINHTKQTTTWFDPRIPSHCQTVPIRMNPMENGLAPAARAQLQQQRRLQTLENERRALQQRQAEITKNLRRQMERRSQSQDNVQAAMNQTQEMLMRQSLAENAAAVTSSLDPFLSTASPTAGQQQQAAAAQAAAAVAADLHDRQESADSGLGMGEHLVHLGSIPEDMDTTTAAMTVTSTAAPAPASTPQQSQPSTDATEQLISTLPAGLEAELSDNLMTWL